LKSPEPSGVLPVLLPHAASIPAAAMSGSHENDFADKTHLD
jgi:hypothetical protein